MELGSITNSSTCSYCPAYAGSRCGETSETAGNRELSPEEQEQVRELEKRDKEVKAHEAAHVAAGGAYVRGGASFDYQVGPDGKRYAVGGEVPIDTSAVSGDPQATIRKMQVVKAAALAPAKPSGADRAIAAKASIEAGKARSAMVKEHQETASTASAKVENSDALHKKLPQIANSFLAQSPKESPILQPLIDIIA